MNLHLAKLHNHVFIRSIYGFVIKVFPIFSDESHFTFLVIRKFTCAVALAHFTIAHPALGLLQGSIDHFPI